MVKESIRVSSFAVKFIALKESVIDWSKWKYQMGHNDLGDHYYSCGDLANAQRSYTYTRDYCASSSHIVEMCLNVIKVQYA
jgi:COP9 signalosome complex subunit 1